MGYEMPSGNRNEKTKEPKELLKKFNNYMLLDQDERKALLQEIKQAGQEEAVLNKLEEMKENIKNISNKEVGKDINNPAKAETTANRWAKNWDTFREPEKILKESLEKKKKRS